MVLLQWLDVKAWELEFELEVLQVTYGPEY